MKTQIKTNLGSTYSSKNSKSASIVEWTLVEVQGNEVSLQVAGKSLIKVIPLEMFNRNWVMVTDNSVETYENGSTVTLDDGALLVIKIDNGNVELYNARKNKKVQIRKIYYEIDGVVSARYFKLQKRVCFLKDVK